MRILISAVNFNDAHRMASQRPRALAELLARRGHEVTVVTMETTKEITAVAPPNVEVISTVPYDEKLTAPVTEIPFSRRVLALLSVIHTTPLVGILKRERLSRILGIPNARRIGLLSELGEERSRTVLAVKAISEDYKWFKQSAPTLRRFAHERPPYDVVFATYSTYGSLWLGELAKSIGLSRYMILDLRDLMNQPGRLITLDLFTCFQQRRSIARANAVTVVSEGLRKNLLDDGAIRRYADKIHVLYNGFLSRDGAKSEAMKEPGNPLRIVYTGSLYLGRRDATPLFTALRKVTTQDPSLSVEVHYAGGAGALFVDMARTEGMESCVVDHGYLPREDAVRLQQDADVLLALSWNTPGNEGILTGKFPEYLANGKPIISIVSGDIPGAELTHLVNNMQLGVGIEEASADEGNERLQSFIKSAAADVASGKSIHWNPVPGAVDRFNYENLTTRLEAIIRKLPR